MFFFVCVVGVTCAFLKDNSELYLSCEGERVWGRKSYGRWGLEVKRERGGLWQRERETVRGRQEKGMSQQLAFQTLNTPNSYLLLSSTLSICFFFSVSISFPFLSWHLIILWISGYITCTLGHKTSAACYSPTYWLQLVLLYLFQVITITKLVVTEPISTWGSYLNEVTTAYQFLNMLFLIN